MPNTSTFTPATAGPSLPQFKGNAAYILPESSYDAMNEVFSGLKMLCSYIGCKDADFSDGIDLEDRIGLSSILHMLLDKFEANVMMKACGLSAKTLAPYVEAREAGHE